MDDVLGRLKSITAHHTVVDIPDNLPPVPLDYVEINQVLSNLIENSAKYAPPGTETRISARLAGSVVRGRSPTAAPASHRDRPPACLSPSIG